MNRRDTLKALGIGTLSAGTLIGACKPAADENKQAPVKAAEERADRQEPELERLKKIDEETFFTPHEMATITVLADIIIPKDERSGSASDAKVPEFIEFIVKDIPDHQTPMRGGLRWLDTKCLTNYGKTFRDSSKEQQLQLIDQIAYPDKAKPEMLQGVAFFNRMRDLTASGFFTSKMGMDDLGFVGNRPNKWEGVPAEIIKQYGLEDVA